MDDYVLVAKDKHGYNVEQVWGNLILKIAAQLRSPKRPPSGEPYSYYSINTFLSCFSGAHHAWLAVLLVGMYAR